MHDNLQIRNIEADRKSFFLINNVLADWVNNFTNIYYFRGNDKNDW